MGLAFRVVVPGLEEISTGEPVQVVAENALRKARAVEGDRVLAADTAVVFDGVTLGKPRDETQAAHFLRRLSGCTHEVMSGIAVREPDGSERDDVAVTRVRFRLLEQADLDWYLATGEWAGRAGAYAIQGKGCRPGRGDRGRRLQRGRAARGRPAAPRARPVDGIAFAQPANCRRFALAGRAACIRRREPPGR